MQITSLDIELTQRCNLNCPYCYLGTIKSKGTIAKETLDDCHTLLDRYGKDTKINFYGGEPLLAFEEIKYFISKATRPYKYTIVSNGTICDKEIVDYVKEKGLSIQRSLDGCPAAMALCRGKGTLEKYNEATPHWKDYGRSRRLTVIPETAKYLVDDLKYFRSLGFKAGFSPMPDYYADWKPQHVQDFKNCLWRLGEMVVKEYKEKGKAFYCYWFDRDSKRFNTGKQMCGQGCGAGNGLYCVAYNGYLYMCHRFTNEPIDSPFCYGHIKEVIEGKTTEGELVKQRLAEMKENKRPLRCQMCVGQYGCNLCCHHSNWKCTGDLGNPPQLYCELKRETAKVVNWIDNQLRTIDPNWWKRETKTATKSKPQPLSQ